MRFPTPALLVALAALTATPLRADETVVVEHLGLRLTLPIGFVAVPQPVPDKGHAVFCGPLGPGQRRPTWVCVSRARGLNGWDAIDPAEVWADLPGATTFTEKWQGSDTVCLRTDLGAGAGLVTLIANVQHGRDAVNVSVGGDTGREAELRELLRMVLADLELDANSLTPETRYETSAEGVGTLSIVAVALFALVFVLKPVRDRLRPHRRPRRGTTTHDALRVHHE